ncbi:MAG: type II toxin-antitoxin system VapC family toxin [Nocardioides sp.]
MVVDSSALVAVVLGEPEAEGLLASMTAASGHVQVSAVSLVESSIVLEARQGPDATRDLGLLLDGVCATVSVVDAHQAELAFAAWKRFGKGRHSAALNLGDCFSYALSASLGQPLLFKGNDFSQTDIALA